MEALSVYSNQEAIMSLMFNTKEKKKTQVITKRKLHAPLYTFSLIAMLVIYGICAIQSPLLLSKYGIQLMVVGFASLLLCSIGQTFIIGLGHVDLGVGNFCGLINVLCCTVLYERPLLGAILLLSAYMMYPLMGYIICKRRVPAIIVTLGASFIWYGVALSLQTMPGGTCPEWMRTIFYTSTPFLNTLSYWLIAFVAFAIFIYRSRYGTILRGFGNNESAMVNSGWSRFKAYTTIYALAGLFVMTAGIMTSSINNASDSSASGTYTCSLWRQ
jgi:ribose transport system ATP-binding protein